MVPPTVSISTASTSVVTRIFRPGTGPAGSLDRRRSAVLSARTACGARGTSASDDPEPLAAVSGPSDRWSPVVAVPWVRSRAATRPTGETTPRKAQRSGSGGSVRLPSCACVRSRTLAGTAHHGSCACPRARQHVPEALRVHLLRPRSGDHHDIEPGQVFGVVTEAFSYLALQPVARYRARAARRGTVSPSLGWFAPLGRKTSVMACAFTRVPPERTLSNSFRRRNRCSGLSRRSESASSAESLLRPFARRALRIRRPALVAMRARKP